MRHETLWSRDHSRMNQVPVQENRLTETGARSLFAKRYTIFGTMQPRSVGFGGQKKLRAAHICIHGSGVAHRYGALLKWA